MTSILYLKEPPDGGQLLFEASAGQAGPGWKCKYAGIRLMFQTASLISVTFRGLSD